jgi:hypothetical protein
VGQEINGNTSAEICEPLHLVSPQIAIEQHAVNKKSRWALAVFDVTDTSGRRFDRSPLRLEGSVIHSAVSYDVLSTPRFIASGLGLPGANGR